MKFMTNFSRMFNPRVIDDEIEEELRFHFDQLTQQYLKGNISFSEAEALAARRFGDREEIKVQCSAIKRRSDPWRRATRAFLALLFLAGFVVRWSSTEQDVRHLGDLLIAIPVLTNLLLYVRGLRPANFQAKRKLGRM